MIRAADEHPRDLAGDFVEADNAAALAAGVDDVRIHGIERDETILEAADREPISISDFDVVAAAVDSGSAAIQLRRKGDVEELVSVMT